MRFRRGVSAVDERGVEVVARRAVAVVAELDGGTGVVERGAGHGQQRGAGFLVEQVRLGRVWRCARRCAAGPAGCARRGRAATGRGRCSPARRRRGRSRRADGWSSTPAVRRWRFAAAGWTPPPAPPRGSARARSPRRADPPRTSSSLVAGFLAGPGEIVEQAGQLDRADAPESAPPGCRRHACAPAAPCRRAPGWHGALSAATASAAWPARAHFRSGRRERVRHPGWPPRSPGRAGNTAEPGLTCRAPQSAARPLRSRVGRRQG